MTLSDMEAFASAGPLVIVLAILLISARTGLLKVLLRSDDGQTAINTRLSSIETSIADIKKAIHEIDIQIAIYNDRSER